MEKIMTDSAKTAIRKPFVEVEKQIEIQKNRNLIITDDEDTKRKIELGNYYNIFNGYKDIFLDNTSSTEKYLSGTTFDEIYNLFLLDRELRSIFMKSILELENSLKSYSARVFSKNYGPYGYLIAKNYDCSTNNKICNVHNLLTRIQAVIGKQLGYSNQMIFHFISVDGQVPIWVLMNKMTIGELSRFFSCLYNKEQDSIAKFFGVSRKDLERYLDNLTYFRNVCAHDERFYNYRTKKPIPDTFIHSALGLPKNKDNNYEKGKTDLFSLLIILKRISEPYVFEAFFDKLCILLRSYLDKIKTVSNEYFLAQMGFPNNWKDILEIS